MRTLTPITLALLAACEIPDPSIAASPFETKPITEPVVAHVDVEPLGDTPKPASGTVVLSPNDDGVKVVGELAGLRTGHVYAVEVVEDTPCSEIDDGPQPFGPAAMHTSIVSLPDPTYNETTQPIQATLDDATLSGSRGIVGDSLVVMAALPGPQGEVRDVACGPIEHRAG